MTTLLIQDGAILGIDPQDTGTEYLLADMVVPKAIIAGHTLVQAELPADYAPGRYRWSDGFVRVPDVQQPTEVPQVLTRRQARRVLLAAGLLDDVEAAVAASDRETQIDWADATEMRRDWPALAAMASQLGMTDAQLDALFVQGAAL